MISKLKNRTVLAISGLALVSFATAFLIAARSSNRSYHAFVLQTITTEYDATGVGRWLKNERTAVDAKGNVTTTVFHPNGDISYIYVGPNGGQYKIGVDRKPILLQGAKASLATIPHEEAELMADGNFVGTDFVMGVKTFVTHITTGPYDVVLHTSPKTDGLPIRAIAKDKEVTIVTEPSSLEFRDPTAEEMWHP